MPAGLPGVANRAASLPAFKVLAPVDLSGSLSYWGGLDKCDVTLDQLSGQLAPENSKRSQHDEDISSDHYDNVYKGH